MSSRIGHIINNWQHVVKDVEQVGTEPRLNMYVTNNLGLIIAETNQDYIYCQITTTPPHNNLSRHLLLYHGINPELFPGCDSLPLTVPAPKNPCWAVLGSIHTTPKSGTYFDGLVNRPAVTFGLMRVEVNSLLRMQLLVSSFFSRQFEIVADDMNGGSLTVEPTIETSAQQSPIILTAAHQMNIKIDDSNNADIDDVVFIDQDTIPDEAWE